jgi:hypothetical protein
MQKYRPLKKILFPILIFLVVSLLMSMGTVVHAEEEGTWVPSLNDRVSPTTDSEYKSVFGDRVSLSAAPSLTSEKLWGVHIDSSHVRLKSDSIENQMTLDHSSLLGVFFERYYEDYSLTFGIDYFSIEGSILNLNKVPFLTMEYQFWMIPVRLKWYYESHKTREGTFFSVGIVNSFLSSAKLKSESSSTFVTKDGQIKSDLDISKDSHFWNRQADLGIGYSFVFQNQKALQVSLAYQFSTMPLTSILGNDIYMSGWNLGFQYLF